MLHLSDKGKVELWAIAEPNPSYPARLIIRHYGEDITDRDWLVERMKKDIGEREFAKRFKLLKLTVEQE